MHFKVFRPDNFDNHETFCIQQLNVIDLKALKDNKTKDINNNFISTYL